MPELRWNPLLETWTMVATNRQNRPHLPEDWCPFCPGEGKAVPQAFDVFAYPNDFPTLSQKPDKIKLLNSATEKNKKAYGKCEVILYSSKHDERIYDLKASHLFQLLKLWQERYTELSKDKKIKYIFEFENRGEEVGVTISHPHGQLYAYSWIPSKIETELNNCKKYFARNKSNLFEDLNISESAHKQRVVAENNDFIAYIPYFTDFPFGVFIVAKNNLQHLGEFSDDELKSFGNILQKITCGFDKIFDKPFPYMMCIHQAPVNSKKYENCEDFFRFHVEFYTPLRAKDKIKWYAGSEMGAGAAANPLDVDECATILRNLL